MLGRPSARWALAVLAGTLVLVGFQVLWLISNRRGYPLDVDESGYMTVALIDHASLSGGGLGDFWRSIQEQVPNAPLVPALTGLLYTLDTGILPSFFVLLGFMVVLVMAVYGIAARLAGPPIGALAALVAATSPGVLAFSRHYVFALPAAALLACAAYALVRSEGMRRTRWALAMGVSLGLMLLARTVTVAFLPGFALAAIVLVIGWRQEDRWRRVANVVVATVAAVAVAGLWYVRNFGAVRDYLTSFGYGAKSSQYGADQPFLSVGRWFKTLQKAGYESLHIVLLLLLVAGLCAVVVVALRRVARSPDRRAAAGRLLRSDALALATVLAVGYAALTSSRNAGLGFSLPLVPLLIVLGVMAVRALPGLRRPAVVVLVATAVLNFASSSDTVDAFASRHDLVLPAIGRVPITDGQPSPVGAVRIQAPGPTLHFAGRDRDWLLTDRDLAGFVIYYADANSGGRGPVVAFGTRHRLVHTNAISLAALLWYGRQVPMAQLTPDLPGGDTAAAYARFLTDPAHGLPNFLITSNTSAGDFDPVVSQRAAEGAARSVGFHTVRTFTLPNGQLLRVWFRKV